VKRHYGNMTFRSGALRAVVVVVVLAAGCGPSRSGAAAPQAVGSHNVLTESDLQGAFDRSLFDTIQRLRPMFFRSRQVASPSTNPEPVHVFVDGAKAEGLETLKLIPPRAVKEVRFYEPQDANVRFGTGHHGGLIAVTLLH
jgi:hypothetical protein